MIRVSDPKTTSLASALLFCSRLVLGVIFIASSLPKLRNPFAFLSSVYSYEMTGPTLSKLLAATIPLLELITGCLLLGGVLLGGALVTSLLLCAMFIVAQASAMWRGLSIGCGCFDIVGSSALVGWGTLTRTAGLTAICVLGLAAFRNVESRTQSSGIHKDASPVRARALPTFDAAHA